MNHGALLTRRPYGAKYQCNSCTNILARSLTCQV